MNKSDLKTVKEWLFWSYANTAMAHVAIASGEDLYSKKSYSIRSKLYKNLLTGTFTIGTIFVDEKIKINFGMYCNYCGSNESLALDHLIPKKLGGKDISENLIYACKTCNSSKGKKDLMEWYVTKNRIPPIFILRRYLKIIIEYCTINNYMDLPINDFDANLHHFKITDIPVYFPKPILLNLEAIPIK